MAKSHVVPYSNQYLDESEKWFALIPAEKRRTTIIGNLFNMSRTANGFNIIAVNKPHGYIADPKRINYPTSGLYFIYFKNVLIYIGKSSSTVSFDENGKPISTAGIIDRLNDFVNPLIAYYKGRKTRDQLDPYQQKFVDRFTVDDLQYITAEIIEYGAGMSEELRRIVDTAEAQAQHDYVLEHGTLPYCNTDEETVSAGALYLINSMHERCEDVTPARLF